jgi:hypothetical protein
MLFWTRAHMLPFSGPSDLIKIDGIAHVSRSYLLFPVPRLRGNYSSPDEWTSRCTGSVRRSPLITQVLFPTFPMTMTMSTSSSTYRSAPIQVIHPLVPCQRCGSRITTAICRHGTGHGLRYYMCISILLVYPFLQILCKVLSLIPLKPTIAGRMMRFFCVAGFLGDQPWSLSAARDSSVDSCC